VSDSLDFCYICVSLEGIDWAMIPTTLAIWVSVLRLFNLYYVFPCAGAGNLISNISTQEVKHKLYKFLHGIPPPLSLYEYRVPVCSRYISSLSSSGYLPLLHSPAVLLPCLDFLHSLRRPPH
jgi:hypothetical protein